MSNCDTFPRLEYCFDLYELIHTLLNTGGGYADLWSLHIRVCRREVDNHTDGCSEKNTCKWTLREAFQKQKLRI